MKAMDEAIGSQQVQALVDRSEMEVRCWQCGNAMHLQLQWVASHRDVCCGDCGMVTVLNTSRIKEEVRHVQSQLRSLHDQIAVTFVEAERRISRKLSPAHPSPRFTPALAKAHPVTFAGLYQSRKKRRSIA